MLFFPDIEHDRPALSDLNTHAIHKAAVSWKTLGTVLLHSHDAEQLKRIEKNYSHDVIQCCRQMLKKWLETDKDASWEKLIRGLQHPSVELNYLADQVTRKLQIGV